ncbi:unnamed protein product [Amoebophrya sp. A25]|nr:unnamed protein product [Amoebophrya sp. A25]|eukprot:GSA25T00011979001.1
MGISTDNLADHGSPVEKASDDDYVEAPPAAPVVLFREADPFRRALSASDGLGATAGARVSTKFSFSSPAVRHSVERLLFLSQEEHELKGVGNVARRLSASDQLRAATIIFAQQWWTSTCSSTSESENQDGGTGFAILGDHALADDIRLDVAPHVVDGTFIGFRSSK